MAEGTLEEYMAETRTVELTVEQWAHITANIILLFEDLEEAPEEIQKGIAIVYAIRNAVIAGDKPEES